MIVAALCCLVFGAGPGDVARDRSGRAVLVAAARGKRERPFVPAPPRVNVITGKVDANLNGDGQPVGAYADPDNATIYLPPDASPFARAHETGHLFDAQVLTDGDRNYFQRIMRAPKGPWDLGKATGRVQGEISPNEWFSDYYAAAATGMTPANGHSVGQFAEIDDRRMRLFESAIMRLAKRRGLEPYR